jgi:hypothetical protein
VPEEKEQEVSDFKTRAVRADEQSLQPVKNTFEEKHMYSEAIKRAAQLAETFAHLAPRDLIDQVEWHLESEGYSFTEIEAATQSL